MAFAGSFKKGQIPVGCKLCEGGSKIQWKCCDCDVLMCTKCKENVQSKYNKGNNHRIIDIKEVRKEDSEETINFRDINCKQHADQPFCLFCKTCKELVCPKCITKAHTGHNLVDEEEYGIKREKIKDYKTRIEISLNNLTKMNDEISKVKNSALKKYNKSKRDILAQKRVVEKLVDKLLKELDDKWKEVHQDLEGKHAEVQKMEKDLQKQNANMGELFKTKDFIKFLEETDKIEIPLNVNDVQINTKYSSMPMFIPGEVTKDNIGTLKIEETSEEQESKMESKVMRQFTSDLKLIHGIAACSDGSLWIYDNKLKLAQHIQIKENNIHELLRLNTKMWDVAVTPGDELLICDGKSSLKLVSKKGELKDSKCSVAPLESIAVHVTSRNQIIIGAMTPGKDFPVTGRRVVIKMDQKGNRLAEYELDSNKKPLFTYPLRITTTSVGNIYVIDAIDRNYRARVVVLSPTGDVINTYSGHCYINNKIPFMPSGIATTTLNNIVVAEMPAQTIHILNSEVHFITYYRTRDLEIMHPFSAAVSTTGNLFIGCITRNKSPDVKAKLYEVEFSGF